MSADYAQDEYASLARGRRRFRRSGAKEDDRDSLYEPLRVLLRVLTGSDEAKHVAGLAQRESRRDFIRAESLNEVQITEL